MVVVGMQMEVMVEVMFKVVIISGSSSRTVCV
jgi:hypothetical protein